MIHYWPMDWKIEGESVKVVKTALVACRPEHRASALAVDPTQFGKSVMSRLWEMYFEKMKEDGAALSTICGVPNYCEWSGPPTHSPAAMTQRRGDTDGRYGFEQAIRYGCGFTSDAASCSHASDDPYILRRAVPSDVPRLLEMWPSNRVNNAIWVDIHPDQLEQHFMWVTGTRREPFSSPHDRVGPGYVLECDGTAVAAAFTSKFPEVGEPSLSRLVIGALLYADETDLPSAARALVSALFGPVGTQAVEEELRWRATEDHVAEPNGPAGMTGSVAQIHWALSEHHPFALAMVDAGVATAEPDLTSYSPYTDWWVDRPCSLPSIADVRELTCHRLVGIPSLPLFCQALKPVLAKRILRARMSSAIDVGKGALLRVSTFSSYADGVQLKVDEAGNIEVTPLRYSKAELQMAPHAPGMGALPHVVGPTGPLTQLLMGYASWSELRKVHRDLCAARRSLPLLEILFPRATTITMHTFG